MKRLKVLFMGTPEFAAVCLKRLTEEKDLEISVVTTPDKAQGRHMVLTPSEVKKTALEAGLPVYQPQTLKNGAFAGTLAEIDPEIILVVAYGKILPSYILDYPKYRCINLHGSLLPKFRGAAPMQRTIIEGEKLYGVTTMYMVEALDAGEMLETWSAPLCDEDDFGTVHDTLAAQGAELLLSTMRKAVDGTLRPVAQNDEDATYAPKIEKSDCLLDFTKSAREVFDRIRGLSPVPLAYTTLRGKTLKILRAQILDEETPAGEPGTVLDIDAEGVVVACGKGKLRLLTLRPEGKGGMSACDFARGRGVAAGDVLGKDCK